MNLNKVFENSALMANGEESNQSICTPSLEELNTYNIRLEMQAITFEINVANHWTISWTTVRRSPYI